MGAFFGMAKKHYVAGNRGGAAGRQLCAVIIPIVIHGIYDTFAFLNRDYASMCLLPFTALLYIIGITVINRLAKDDWKMSIYPQRKDRKRWSLSEPTRSLSGTYSHNTVKATNGFSIAGLICGIIAYLTMATFVLPSLLAIIFQFDRQKKHSAGSQRNSAAKAGDGYGESPPLY